MSSSGRKKIRLYVPERLSERTFLTLSEASSHYLCNVMRVTAGQIISCFNGSDGEYDCSVSCVHKKHMQVEVRVQTRCPRLMPDVWLLFAPVKKEQTDFIVEKATELGVAKIIPVITARTVAGAVRTERFAAQAVEAAEQCERLDVPEILPAVPLSRLLQEWPAERKLFFMDEREGQQPCAQAFAACQGHPAAILTGPEGGFSPDEAEQLRHLPFVGSISLGPRILRAETAVAAALSVWQAVAGDWVQKNGEAK